jgi:hypothetical protein
MSCVPKLRITFLLPLWLLSSTHSELENPYPAGNKELNCQPENNTFDGGETLTYRIYYNWNFIWLSAGEVVFKIEDQGSNYRLSAHGRTYSSYDWFFKADDYFESIIDKNSLLPVQFKRDIKENKYRYFEKVHFDHQGNQLKSWTGKSEETAVETNHEVKGCVRDILSMIYAVRVLNFEAYQKGKIVPVHIFLNKKEYHLNLQYFGKKEDKKIYKKGRYTTYHLSPEVIQGTVFKEKNSMNIWASADENKVPLLIESPVSVGSVKAILIDHKGLRYPFVKLEK